MESCYKNISEISIFLDVKKIEKIHMDSEKLIN